MLEEKIRETGKTFDEAIANPEGTRFNFSIMQIVFEPKLLDEDLINGFDPDTLEIYY